MPVLGRLDPFLQQLARPRLRVLMSPGIKNAAALVALTAGSLHRNARYVLRQPQQGQIEHMVDGFKCDR